MNVPRRSKSQRRVALLVVAGSVALAFYVRNLFRDSPIPESMSETRFAKQAATLPSQSLETVERSQETPPHAPHAESHGSHSEDEAARILHFEQERDLASLPNGDERRAVAREILAEPNHPMTLQAMMVLADCDAPLAREEFLRRSSADHPGSWDGPLIARMTRSLTRIGGVLLREDLVALFESGHRDVQLRCAQGLRDLGDDSWAKRLSEEWKSELRSPTEADRTRAVQGLGELKVDSVRASILDCLEDSSPSVRRAALVALMTDLDADVVARIQPLSEDPDSRVRLQAEAALRRWERNQ